MLPGSRWDSACRCRSSSVVNLPTEAISCGSEPGGVLVEICWLMDYFFILSIPGRNRTNYVVLSLKTCVLGRQKFFLQAKNSEALHRYESGLSMESFVVHTTPCSCVYLPGCISDLSFIPCRLGAGAL